MAFVNMALQTNFDRIVRHLERFSDSPLRSMSAFEDLLRMSAEELDVFSILDARLRQSDDPRSLHITMMGPGLFNWLHGFDNEYHMSENA